MTGKILLKEFNALFKHYNSINSDVCSDIFLYSLLEKTDKPLITNRIKPILFEQMSVLYNVDPKRFENYINNDFLGFLSHKYKKNIVFLLSNDGFLLYIMLMNTTIQERVTLNDFFAFHIDVLNKYNLYTYEYEPVLEGFKLLNIANYNKFNKDILIYFK